jgi:LPXTG-motif cell wall-anchored protein
MVTYQQSEVQPEETTGQNESNDSLLSVIGILLIMILIWVTVKGKLRDWFMK